STTTASPTAATRARARAASLSFTTPSPAFHLPATRRTRLGPDNDTDAQGAHRRGRRGDRPGDGAPPRRRRLRRDLGRERRPGARPPPPRAAGRVRARPDAAG